MLWCSGLFLQEEQWRGTLETWWCWGADNLTGNRSIRCTVADQG